MSRMYGTVIRVPSTVPVDVCSCEYRNRYTAGYEPYFDGRKRPSYGSKYETMFRQLFIYKHVVAARNTCLINDEVAVTQGK
jgi:hypothetical protein